MRKLIQIKDRDYFHFRDDGCVPLEETLGAQLGLDKEEWIFKEHTKDDEDCDGYCYHLWQIKEDGCRLDVKEELEEEDVQVYITITCEEEHVQGGSILDCQTITKPLRDRLLYHINDIRDDE